MENFGIRTSEEGVHHNEQDLPLDIFYSKLPEWLIERKKVVNDWRKRVATIQARIAKEIKTLPRDQDPWLLSLSPETTSYFEACKVRDILSDLNPEQRTIFGGLSGSAGVWNSIVRAYERDNVFLGEAAQILVQYTNYEIPYFKKQMSKLQQQSLDFDRKKAEYKKNAALSAQKYEQACQELGIEGKDIKKDVQGLVRKLPPIFDSVVTDICSTEFGTAMELYQQFTDFVHPQNNSGSRQLLPNLRRVRSNPPDASLPLFITPHEEAMLDKEEVVPAGIDWEGLAADAGASAEESPAISWDIGALDLQEESTDTVEAQGIPAVSEEWIDWDIEISEDRAAMGEVVNASSVSVVADAGEAVVISSEKSDRAHPLSVTEERNRIVDELFELHAFLRQRIAELKLGEFPAIQSQLQCTAPAFVQQNNLLDSLLKLDGLVLHTLNKLSVDSVKDLLRILTSPRFVERLCATLEQKRSQELNSLQSLRDMEVRHQQLRSTLAATWPKHEAAVSRVRAVKEAVEQGLRKQTGRPVNIIGEINNLIG